MLLSLSDLGLLTAKNWPARRRRPGDLAAACGGSWA
jgi:hypothetical protein